MLVDGESLDAAPAADALLEAAGGKPAEQSEIALSFGLVLHSIELRREPRREHETLPETLAANVRRANGLLAREGLRLLPTAMHPWLEPGDARLWPHGTPGAVHAALDRLFSCKTHGWANQQSFAIELPFDGDEQFVRLHAAVRFLLPIVPALAASSPIVGGERNGVADNRLAAYRGKCARLPAAIGAVVPEPVGSIGEYRERVLEPLYRELEPHDPEGLLRQDWINARAAFVRLDRSSVELRVLDLQEAPAMDAAFAALIVEVLKLLCAEQWLDAAGMNRRRTEELGRLLELAARQGEGLPVGDRPYLQALGFRGGATELKGLWEHLIDTVSARGSLSAANGRRLEHYLRHGTLATRIGKAVGLAPTRAKLMRVYEELCEALAGGTPFAPPPPAAH
ncbi:MAG TPA: glutamate-cysteine ligase family protein [Gammaproteobacteria bacterium]|nr:glutamate-cysteine ligase family protein [Gammaproteobacteria bacterium]